MENLIVITNRQRKTELTKELSKTLTACAEGVLKAEGFPCPAEVSVSLVSKERIRSYNLELRGKNSVTDVLSFPLLELKEGEGEVDDLDLNDGRALLGDIVICPERARAQAEEYGHSFLREMGFLMVHGMLHLLGFDHMEEAERARMRAREEAVLLGLGLTR